MAANMFKDKIKSRKISNISIVKYWKKIVSN